MPKFENNFFLVTQSYFLAETRENRVTQELQLYGTIAREIRENHVIQELQQYGTITIAQLTDNLYSAHSMLLV